MRQYAILKQPIKCNKKDCVYKIMLHETKNEVFLYQYCSVNAVQCSFDIWYPDVESVYEDWNDEIDENGWTNIDDPLPYCQHDAFLPIRIKGRNIGKPQWGQFEILKNGEWVDYVLEEGKE